MAATFIPPISTSPTKKAETATPSDLLLAALGGPQLLEGEEVKHYKEIARQLRTSIKPRNVIEELLVHDMTRRQWEILRYQRLKKT